MQKWQNKEWALASIPVESDRRHCWGPEECFRFSGEEGMMKHPTDFKQVWIGKNVIINMHFKYM